MRCQPMHLVIGRTVRNLWQQTLRLHQLLALLLELHQSGHQFGRPMLRPLIYSVHVSCAGETSNAVLPSAQRTLGQ